MKFASRCRKEHLHNGLNVFRSFSVCHKLSQLAIYKICFTNQLILPSVFIKAWLMLIQNNIYRWTKITQIESPQRKYCNNIGDLSIKSFLYHNSDTKRNPWVMLCSHCPINDSSGYLHNTVNLAVTLQAYWHTAEGN